MAEGKNINLGHMMHRWGQLIVASLRKEVSRDDTLASGRLLASIHPVINVFGDRFEMEIIMEDYWENIDKGQRPGTKPDVNKILRWMRHKGIVPKPGKSNLTGKYSKRARKTFKDRRLQLAERIASAIQRKGTIKRFGYKGSGFVSEFTDTLAARMRSSIMEAAGKDITIQIKKAIK